MSAAQLRTLAEEMEREKQTAVDDCQRVHQGELAQLRDRVSELSKHKQQQQHRDEGWWPESIFLKKI